MHMSSLQQRSWGAKREAMVLKLMKVRIVSDKEEEKSWCIRQYFPQGFDFLRKVLGGDIRVPGRLKSPALRSIPTNKACGGDGIPAELFQILKDDAVKVLHSCASKFGKLSHRTGKGQFSFQSQRRTMPKNAQTAAQLHSFHMLAK